MHCPGVDDGLDDSSAARVARHRVELRSGVDERVQVPRTAVGAIQNFGLPRRRATMPGSVVQPRSLLRLLLRLLRAPLVLWLLRMLRLPRLARRLAAPARGVEGVLQDVIMMAHRPYKGSGLVLLLLLLLLHVRLLLQLLLLRVRR